MQKNTSDKLIDSFQPGDLLFGLENEARDLFYCDLKSKLTKLNAKYHYVTLDEIVKPMEPYYIYDDDLRMSPLKEESSPVRNHAQVLLSSPSFTDISHQDLSPCSKEHSKIMVSCFLAIENYPGMIHFCLDGLDYKKMESNSYTSNELRYVANNFAKLKHKVAFYRNGYRVDPPWILEELSPVEWLENNKKAEYHPEPVVQAQNLAPRKLFFTHEDNQPQSGIDHSKEPDNKRIRVESH